jgi:quinol monooxygenase YgiN
VVARIRAVRGRERTVEVALKDLLAPTRAEAGCRAYDLFQNMETPCEFALVEEWEGEAAHEAHMRAPHVQRMLAEAGPFLAAPPEIRRYPA